MPPSLTQTLDNLYTTTWQLRKNKAHDNIFTATPFWFWLKEKGKFKTEEGGRFIEEPFEYAKNDNVVWLGKGGAVSLNDYEFLTTSKWDWRYLVGSMVRFGVDDQQNRGKAAIIKLMNSKMNNTENSMIDTLETALFTAQSGLSIEGLPDLVQDAPATSNDAGGVDPSVYTWFQNKSSNMSGLSMAVYLVAKMTNLLNLCMNNRAMDRPDIIITTQAIYEAYDAEVLEQKQIVNKTLGDAGFTNIEFKGMPMVWSPACGSGRLYTLNTNYIYLTYDPMLNFDMTNWKEIPDQVNDRAAQIVLACALMVTRRMCQGVIYNATTA